MATQIANSLSGTSTAETFGKRTTRIVHVDFEAAGTDVEIQSKVEGASNWNVETTVSGGSGEASQTTLSPNPDRLRINVTAGTASAYVQE